VVQAHPEESFFSWMIFFLEGMNLFTVVGKISFFRNLRRGGCEIHSLCNKALVNTPIDSCDTFVLLVKSN
jgi:biopolymer transport protein ExbB/TolQ